MTPLRMLLTMWRKKRSSGVRRTSPAGRRAGRAEGAGAAGLVVRRRGRTSDLRVMSAITTDTGPQPRGKPYALASAVTDQGNPRHFNRLANNGSRRSMTQL